MLMGEMYKIISKAAGIPLRVVEDMDWADIQKATQIVSDLMDPQALENVELPQKLEIRPVGELTELEFSKHLTAEMVADISVGGDQDDTETDSEEVDREYELPHTVKLSRPIVLGSEEKENITFKNRLNGRMLKKLEVGKNGSTRLGSFYPIISKMTGETPITINRMLWVDLNKCLPVITYFLASGR